MFLISTRLLKQKFESCNLNKNAAAFSVVHFYRRKWNTKAKGLYSAYAEDTNWVSGRKIVASLKICITKKILDIVFHLFGNRKKQWATGE